MLLALQASAQSIPKLPEKVPGLVDITFLKNQPTKIIDPVYPAGASQEWIQGTIALDIVIGKTGAVEKIGCDKYCRMSPNVLIEAATEAVGQWKWDPILVGGKPVRVRTTVVVNFVLDEKSPAIDLCTVLRDPAFFDRRMVNVFGTVERVDGLKVLRSPNCGGIVVVADDADVLRPLKNDRYVAFESAVASGPINVSLRANSKTTAVPVRLVGNGFCWNASCRSVKQLPRVDNCC